jgi:predicted  nucleic acid-binding Zn-ribbon protein
VILTQIWLGYRASSLLVLPVDQVIRLLNLDVPATPQIALDAVTSETISLRWQVPDKQSVSKHLIQLNGTIIGESDKKDTNVIITGLNPDQLYCIRVIASNAQRLHSASETIRVRTRPRTEEGTSESHDHVPVIHTHPPFDPPQSATLPPQSRHRLSSAREQPVRRLSNAAKAERARSNSNPQSPTPQTLEHLAAELDRITRETAETTTQLEIEEDKNRAEISKLESEVDDLRIRRKEDEDSRSQIKAETKSLEETKRSVDAQKSRLERALRVIQDDLAKLESEASSRLRDLSEKEQALADLCDQTAIAERQCKEVKSIGKEGLLEVQLQITALEESYRVLVQRIATIKSQAEIVDAEEDRIRRASIDQREDEEDLKVEREWIESENALKSRHDEVRAQLDEVSP